MRLVLAVAFNPVAQRPVALIQIRAPLDQVVLFDVVCFKTKVDRTICRIVCDTERKLRGRVAGKRGSGDGQQPGPCGEQDRDVYLHDERLVQYR